MAVGCHLATYYDCLVKGRDGASWSFFATGASCCPLHCVVPVREGRLLCCASIILCRLQPCQGLEARHVPYVFKQLTCVRECSMV